MGIRGLSNLIRKEYSDCLESAPISELEGKTIAFDLPCLAYRFWHRATNQRYGCTRSNVDSSVKSFVRSMAQFGIKTLFVAEGYAPDHKRDTLLKRQQMRQQMVCRVNVGNDMLREYENTGVVSEALSSEWRSISNNDNNSKKYDLQPERPFDSDIYKNILKARSIRASVNNDIDFKYVTERLRDEGATVINSPTEAETMCGAIVKCGLADMVYTRDYDMLAYKGITTVIFNLSTYRQTYTSINVPKLLNRMGLSHDQFVDFCIASGTDYNRCVMGGGPHVILNAIVTNGNLRNALKSGTVLESVVPNYEWIMNLFCNTNASELVGTLSWNDINN